MTSRICVVTGSRAEYGLLYWVLHDLRERADVELQLVVTGMHLSPEFGLTVSEIERDGFQIHRRVEMLLSSDTADGVCKSVALGLIGMSAAIGDLRPDLVLLLGDRFEILAAAQACLFHKVPVAHIAGGDTTEGAFDEAIRHSVTKMSHLHLVTNEEAAQRVRQLGEDPSAVHVVGSPGLDHLVRQPLLDRAALSSALGAPLATRNILVTFHPETLGSEAATSELEELLSALDGLPNDFALWITKPNADTGGRSIAATLEAWCAARNGRARLYTSLGHLRYLSLMSHADVVVGNSSSGLYEAPSLHVPTVNIGDRQRGRLSATSVIHCRAERAAILSAIHKALSMDCSQVTNPYGDGHSAQRIVEIVTRRAERTATLRKRFHRVEQEHG